MRSVAQSLCLSLLFAGAVFRVCGETLAEAPTAGFALTQVTHTTNEGMLRAVETRGRSSNMTIVSVLEEPLPSPAASESSVLRPVPPHSMPYSPLPHSLPLGLQSLEETHAWCPPAGDGMFWGGGVSFGESASIPNGLALPADRAYLHPAPEVVLRFSASCRDEMLSNWSLSSRDMPRSRPVIPHGPLMLEFRSSVEPVDFVELILDGKPLRPTDDAPVTPLSYQLPCPVPGQHVLQARFLSGNIWSRYSSPLQFEVRLPKQPRIIAVSDFDRDPVPLVRHAMTSITTGSIKIHLGNVARNDSIVAYVDGQPVPTQRGNESCCRIMKVEGSIIPGVHKLTVRSVACPGACSITSHASNEVTFHYYDESIYLLRPGTGCNNKRSNNNGTPNLHSTSRFRQATGDVPLPRAPQCSGIARHDQSPDKFARQGAGKIGEALGVYFVSHLQTDAASHPQHAGRVLEMNEATERAWDEAEEKAAYEAAGARLNAARAGSDEDGVRRARENAAAAKTRANHAWSKAASRVAEAEANASLARAEAIVGPPSPFYFASAAHFPVPDFGLRGESVQKESLVIYEDMRFSFDRDGNYEVRFRASTPKLPATIQLQLHLQSNPDGPWYTITLAPIEFAYPPVRDSEATHSRSCCDNDREEVDCCGRTHHCVCKGTSEILRRCYGEFGQSARIRRTGSARFGFGVNVP